LEVSLISNNVDGTLTVAPKSYRMILGKTKLCDKFLNPKNFSSTLTTPWHTPSVEEREIAF